MRAFLPSVITKIVFAALLLSFISSREALAGTIPSTGGSYTINNTIVTFSGTAASGNFQTFTDAVAALNASYTASLNGAVTFTVSSGQTFTEATYPLIINDNSNNPNVMFVTDGVSANPVIQSLSTGSGTKNVSGTISSILLTPSMFGDAFVIFNGTDNIIFKGIDLKDIYVPTAALDAKVMDIGYFLVRNGGNDGCQNVTIQNCNITMTSTYNTYNNSTFGIVQESIGSSSNTPVPPTSASGLHNGNKFYSNVIKNVAGGILVAGTTQASPFTLFDQNCQVGSATAGTGNTITNFGGASNVNAANTLVKFGVLENFQTNFSIVGNIISNGTNTDALGTSLWGIVFGSGVNVNISNNKIYGLNSTISSGTLCLLAGIVSGYKTPAGTGAYYVYNNFIGDLNSTTGATGIPAIAGIYQALSSVALVSPLGFYNNTVWLNNSSGINTAGIYLLSTANVIKDFRNNIIVNTSYAGTKYTYAFGRASGGSYTDLASTTNNNLYFAGTPGPNNLICGIVFPPATSYQTLCDYQKWINAGVCPGTGVESASISYDPNWVNNSNGASSTFLTLAGSQAAIGGGAGISTPISISSDYFGTARLTSGATTIGGQEVTTSFSSNTITTGTVSGSSPYCPNGTVTVPFTVSGTFNPGNVFSAEISDLGGNFSSTAPLGSLTQTGAGTITCNIPNVPAGSGYRIRIVSSDPVVIGSPNSVAMTFGSVPTFTTGNGSIWVCNGMSSANVGYNSLSAATTNGPPSQYQITYNAASLAAGLVPTGLLTMPTGSGVAGAVPMPLPSAVNGSIYNDFFIGGWLQIKDNNNSPYCISAPTPFTYTVYGQVSATLGLSPVVCSGTTTANLPYSATTGDISSGAWYSLTFDGAAHTAGFADITMAQDKTFPATGPLAITVPGGAAAGTYNCILNLRSNSTSCINTSPNFPFTITITPSSPETPSNPSGPASICPSSVTTSTYTTSATNAASYNWTLTPGAGTIVTGSTSATVTWSPTYSGTAVVSVQAANGCGTNATAATTNVSVSCGFNITASAGSNGSISPSGTTVVAANGSQTYTLTPATACYKVTTLTVDGSTVTPVPSYTFSNVTATHTIAVTFAVNPPLSGTYSVNTSVSGTANLYPYTTTFNSMASAIVALNCSGVAAPGATFNVITSTGSPYTETFTSATTGLITATGTASAPIVFQKSGTGPNPAITAGTPGTGNRDGIIVLSGTDYITFDGINLQDNPANAPAGQYDTIKVMEWGYALLKNSGTDGCQHVIIRNCKVSMNNNIYHQYYNVTLYNESYPAGIYSNNHTISSISPLTVSSALGENSNNQIYRDTIINASTGIQVWGYNDATSTYFDKNNQIGVSGGNVISVYSNNAVTTFPINVVWGIYAESQDGMAIANDSIYGYWTTKGNTGGLIATGYNYFGNNCSYDIYNNKIVAAGGTYSANSWLITNNAGGGTSGTINIYGNTITAAPGFVSAQFYAIRNGGACYNLNIYNNVVSGFVLSGVGGSIQSAIYNTGAIVNSLQIYNNSIYGNAFRFAEIIFNGFNTQPNTYSIYGNSIYNNTASLLGLYCIYSGILNANPYMAAPSVYSNVIHDNSGPVIVYGYYSVVTVGGTENIYSNTIYNLSNTGSAVVAGIFMNGANAANIHDNLIYGLSTTGTGAVNGILNSAGTTRSVYNNKLFNISTTSTSTGNAEGLNITGGTTVTAYNNMIYDIQANTSTTTPSAIGLSITGGTTQNIYFNTVYLNGSSSANNHKTAAINITAGTVDLRNNILDNSYTETGTGCMAVALYKSAFNNSNLASTTNRNLVYAGTPGTKNLLISDGTNTTGSTMTVYKSTLSTIDQNAVTGDPLFVSASGTINLHLQNSGLLSPAINSGAAAPGVTDDIDGQTRPLGAAGKYDIGADEINEVQLTQPTQTAGFNPACTHTTVTYSIPAITNATSYTWTLPGVLGTDYTITGSSTTNAITVVYLTTQSGNITANGILVPAGSGYTYNGPASATAAFSTLTSPTIAVSPSSGDICLGDVLQQTASGANTYTWAPSAGLDITAGATINASPAGNATYTVTGTALNGCSSTTTDVITIKPLPPVVVTPNNAVCTGGTTATLVASGADTYTWSPISNLTPSNGTSATETAQISLLTIYTVTGTGTNGCTANTVVPVATVAVGGAISPVYSIICSGGTKPLTVSGAAGNYYQWQISSNNATWSDISGATNTTYTTNTTDGNTNKYYRLQAQSNSCWNVASTTAEVDVSQPTINVTTSALTDNSVTLNWTPIGSGNYTINYTGASTGTVLGTTPPKTLNGLTANGNYTITLNQTGAGLGTCPASGTATVTTLCPAPTAVTIISTGTNSITLTWTGGAGNYRVYYRPLYVNNGYFTKDVIGGTSTSLTKQGSNSLYHSLTYEIYVTKLDCPALGNVGQPSAKVYATTTPALACAAPVIDSVKSACPVQLEVFMHGSPTNQYFIDVERLTPTIQPVQSFPVTGSYFTANVSAGQNYLITARSRCGIAVSNLTLWPGALQVKPQCGTLNNLLLSNPTCNGFTVSWNADQCLANNASYYELYIRQVGTLNWNGYGVIIPTYPIGPYKLVNWLPRGKSYDVYAKAVYSCNGYLTYGATTQTTRITTLSAGCREEASNEEQLKPITQQTSPDNSEVFTLYPNPNSGKFTVDLSRLNTNEDAVRIEVTNILGQTAITQLTSISDGHLTEFINMPASATSGTYIVRVTAGKNVYTSKMNVSK